VTRIVPPPNVWPSIIESGGFKLPGAPRAKARKLKNPGAEKPEWLKIGFKKSPGFCCQAPAGEGPRVFAWAREAYRDAAAERLTIYH